MEVAKEIALTVNGLPIPMSGRAWKTFQRSMALLRSLGADDVEYVRSNSKRSARFMRNGEALHTVQADVVASTKQAAIELLYRSAVERLKKEAVELALARAKKETSSAKKQALKADLLILEQAMREHGDLISNAHHIRDLDFAPLPEGVFDSKASLLIYESPPYSKKRGSVYKLVLVDKKPAYARESDHWGEFYTRDFDFSNFKEGRDSSDGWSYWKHRNWQLLGAERNDGTRRAGYVLLEDLAAQK